MQINIFVFMIIVSKTISNITIPKFESYEKINNFVFKYFSGKSITIVSNATYVDDIPFSLKVATQIITNLDGMNTILQAHSNFIFLDRTIFSFLGTLNAFNRSRNWSSSSKFLVIFENIEKQQTIAAFRKLWEVNIYNAVIFTNFKTSFTWYPYSTESNCGKTINIVKTKRINPFIKKIPYKLDNCKFSIANCPYVLFYDNKTNTGVTTSLIDTLGEKINLNISVLKYPDYLQHFVKYGNFDLLVYNLETFDLDAAVYGSYYGTRLTSYQCEYSVAAFINFFVIILPPRSRIEPNMVLVFAGNLYIPIVVTFIVLIIVWKITTKNSVEETIFTIYKLLVIVQLQFRQLKDIKSSLLLIFILYYCFHINCFHQTKLSSVLTSPVLSPKIKNVEQFLKTDYMLLSEHGIEEMVRPRGRETFNKIKEKRIETENAVGELERFFKEPKYGIAILGSHLNLVKNLQDIEVMYDDP
ncbi:Ionotropic receptor 174, partial [Diabrotica virgifera virgifera]